jgi:hypothetical protein
MLTTDGVIQEASAARQCRVMQAAFQQAMENHPHSLSESCYTFGAGRVRVRVVGSELARHIVRPFSHLRTSDPIPACPQLTIDLWDENATGIRCQVAPPNGRQRWGQQTAMSPGGRFVLQQLPNTLTCLDLESERIVGSITWSNHLFIYERAKPLARLLLEWHNHRDVQVVHAGLVSKDGQGILFVGQSGSGKSTAALACLCGGFSFLSEDYVGLCSLPDGSLAGHSLFNSVFLETDHLSRFPELEAHVLRGRPPEEAKSVVVLSEAFPERLERVAPIRAVVITHVLQSSQSQIARASRGEALLALGTSSMLQIPSPGMRGFDRMGQLIEQVPCYRLGLGLDLESIPFRVGEIVAKASHS